MKLTLDVFRDLGAAMGVALIAIYLLLVGRFRSFTHPGGHHGVDPALDDRHHAGLCHDRTCTSAPPP